jgi:cytochrome c-type biogenesis protein CcmH/NrfF
VKQRSLVAAALLSGLLTVAFASACQEQEDAGWGYALADELMSPWCPGFALPDCASGYASDLRLWILEQERLGRPEAEVKAEILARYGEQMLQAPRAEGRGALAYAIPAALVGIGLAVLIAFLRKQGSAAPLASGSENPGPNGEALAGTPDAELLSRVDAEIAHFESTHD